MTNDATRNKIEAHHRNISEILSSVKYTVDYFQREYSWQEKHVRQLVEDLTSAFLHEYSDGDSRTKGETYNNYYLGPFVVSRKNGKRSIIDGQQRLTSLTLFLIFLNNYCSDLEVEADARKELSKIGELIFSDYRGVKSFNIQVEERIECMRALLDSGAYNSDDEDDESVINMAARYNDIVSSFPEEINATNIMHFWDWIRFNVILVEIIAYSDENAYTIFETMNDRGLNLTPAEMLKGYLLSRLDTDAKRKKTNDVWKSAMQRLHVFDKGEDLKFFQAWFRSQYADTIRQGRAGSQNEDFEKIGTRFHSWFRDNLPKVGLDENKSEQFEAFLANDFDFYLKSYLKILEAQTNLTPGLEHIYYISKWGIANTLSYPLMLAPLTSDDSKESIERKMSLVARYIEIFVVRRSVNFRKFSASSIRYTMYSLVKEIRGQNLDALHAILSEKLGEMEESWTGVKQFKLHGQNANFTKFFLSRLTGFVDEMSGRQSDFKTFFSPAKGKPFEIEHIWANKFERHRDEFDQERDFEDWRNNIGAMVLLPNGTNQSFGGDHYAEKRAHYVKENLLAASLVESCYEKNPNFTKAMAVLGVEFKAHPEFKKTDIEARHTIIQKLAELVFRL